MICFHNIFKNYIWKLLKVNIKRYKNKGEDGDMTQWLRTSTALGEDKGSVPSTHMSWLISACNFSFRVFDYLFWPL